MRPGPLRARRLALATSALILGLAAWLWWPPGAPPPPQDRAAPQILPAHGPLRLTVTGTSLTAAYDWPERLTAALADCLGREVRLARVARSGETSAWGLTQIEAIAATRPDILLLEFAINDADLRDGQSLRKAGETHRQLIAGLRRALPDTAIVLMTMSPAQGPRGLIRPFLAQHYAAYRDLARDADLGLVDLYPRWLALPRGARGLAADGLHPEAGVAAAMILPPLLTALGQMAGRDCPEP